MTIPCIFCGSETEAASNRMDMPSWNPRVPPTRFFRHCRNLECRARGPAMKTPEAANLAYLVASANAAAGCLALAD